MSAQHAAELLTAHTQAASYHQGKEEAYGMAMRLVRNMKQTAYTRPMAEVIAMLDRTETVLYDAAQEAQTKKDARNRVVNEADALLSDLSNRL